MQVLFHYAAGPVLKTKMLGIAAHGLKVKDCAESDVPGFETALPDIDVLWHVLKPVTAAHIAQARRLKLIQKIGVGVNTIALDAAKARGIAVCNMPGTNSRAVAEFTLALMLATLRRLPFVDAETRAGRGWSFGPEIQDRLGELHGRTVGLVGYGAVPSILAPILKAMGAEIVYASRTPKPEAVGARRPLHELLSQSDIVSLHVPLTPETTGLIGADALRRLKPGAVLINTARGGLVDQAALVDALKSGRLAAAGLDVFADEPVRTDDPLLGLANVVLAPHLAWLTGETLDRSLAVAVENCRRLAAGEALLNRVA
jgi:phosphoglycerate dehydrogenase-like enzyme